MRTHLNLAYRWFCRLSLEDEVPNHSTFSKKRHGRFRDSDLFHWLFNEVLRHCIDTGQVKGEGFAVDADASRQSRCGLHMRQHFHPSSAAVGA